MLNETGAFLLQTVLYLASTNSPSAPTINVTLLEEPVNNPFFENDTMVCYGLYGCFSTVSPWIDVKRPVCNKPEKPTKVNPGYCLLTRTNPTTCQYLHHTNLSSIYRSYYSPTRKTFVLIHGFLENGGKPWLRNMSAELLRRLDVNVIIVDWGNGSALPYTQAVANTRVVGRMTALLIYTLKVLTKTATQHFHMIGHSLGSHISGYVGYTLKHYFNCSLGRITGMDPAEPHFADTLPIVRLDISDALFVDIIHTNARPFITGGLGINNPIGHIDFYPNSGDNQPGCSQGLMRLIKNENQSVAAGFQKFMACDHVRSHQFMLESINSQFGFLSVECESWESFLAGACFPCKSKMNPSGARCARFGLPARTDYEKLNGRNSSEFKLNLFYTITNSEKPFCATLYRITVNISNSIASHDHKGEIGIFSIAINGTKGTTKMTPILKEQYFAPGSSLVHVIGGANVGNITNISLNWEHRTTINIITWRFDAVIHIGSVTVETFTDSQRIRFCPQFGEILSSKSTMKMKPCLL